MAISVGILTQHFQVQTHILFSQAPLYTPKMLRDHQGDPDSARKSPPMTIFGAVEPVVDFTRFSHWIRLRKNRITEKHSIKHGLYGSLPTKDCVLPISPLCESENAGYPQFVAIVRSEFGWFTLIHQLWRFFFMSFRPAEICVGPERCQEGLAGSLSLPRFGPVEWSLVPWVPCCGDKFYQGKWNFHGKMDQEYADSTRLPLHWSWFSADIMGI